MSKHDNPPAFPMPDTFNANNDCQPGHTGMTLRDYFAAKAMQGFIAAYLNTGRQEPTWDYIHAWSFQMADAMLEARVK